MGIAAGGDRRRAAEGEALGQHVLDLVQVHPGRAAIVKGDVVVHLALQAVVVLIPQPGVFAGAVDVFLVDLVPGAGVVDTLLQPRLAGAEQVVVHIGMIGRPIHDHPQIVVQGRVAVTLEIGVPRGSRREGERDVDIGDAIVVGACEGGVPPPDILR